MEGLRHRQEEGRKIRPSPVICFFFQQGSEVKVKPPALETGPGMYCFQPPLQHMYCPSQPPFHQVGLGQVGLLPQSLRILCGCVVWGCVYICMGSRALILRLGQWGWGQGSWGGKQLPFCGIGQGFSETQVEPERSQKRELGLRLGQGPDVNQKRREEENQTKTRPREKERVG